MKDTGKFNAERVELVSKIHRALKPVWDDVRSHLTPEDMKVVHAVIIDQRVEEIAEIMLAVKDKDHAGK